MDQWFEFEGLDPLAGMAFLTMFNVHFPSDLFRVFRVRMIPPGAVADLAAGILQFRGFGRIQKSPRFPVAGGMALVTGPDLLGGQSLFHLFNALEGMGFFGVFLEGIELFRMTTPAGLRTDVAVYLFFRVSRREGQGQRQSAEQQAEQEEPSPEEMGWDSHLSLSL
jgi:hypothetical protein